MPEIIKDFKIIKTYSKLLRTVTLLKAALTVGIIAFSVLSAVKLLPSKSKNVLTSNKQKYLY